MIDRPIILTGFMGSGKSSVGKIIAERLGVKFIDLDAAIVAGVDRSIKDIFTTDGEEAFRVLENTALEQVLATSGGAVIATGGGAVIAVRNRFLMKNSGIIVNLKVTLSQVLKRLHGSNDRPLLAVEDGAQRAAALLAEREQFYADADIRIDTDDKSVEDVATEIQCRLEDFKSESALP